jgi:deaminated glutathione amidase
VTTVACIQMASGPAVGANLLEAERLIGMAVDKGAKLIVLPENFAIMGKEESDKVAVREADDGGPIQDFLSQQAVKQGVWLVGGTVPMVAKAENKIRAACLLYDDQGKQAARYDKIHLFDVSLVDSDESYAESEAIESGDQAVVVETPFGKLGLAVCYDLRFPELFRTMLDQGMDIIAMPAAFTAITGKAHWGTLVRARAIENLCYVLAAGQGGYHVNGRETYGHSMIVDPWGQVMNELANGSGLVCAEIDMDRLKNIRRTFPALEHRNIVCRVF